MELTEVMTWIVTVVAMVIAWLLKMYKAKTGVEFSTKALQWIVFGLAVVLSIVFNPPVFSLPSLGGSPVEIVGALLTWFADLFEAVGPIFTAATLLYSSLMKSIFEKIQAKFAKG